MNILEGLGSKNVMALSGRALPTELGIQNQLLNVLVPQCVLFVDTVVILSIEALLAEAEEWRAALLVDAMQNVIEKIEPPRLLHDERNESRALQTCEVKRCCLFAVLLEQHVNLKLQN